jgi:hypothetical protein
VANLGAIGRSQLLPWWTGLGLRVLHSVLHREQHPARHSSLVGLVLIDELTSQGYEPTSMRAIRARYDPYEQSKGRVEQLRSLGHSVDKVSIQTSS